MKKELINCANIEAIEVWKLSHRAFGFHRDRNYLQFFLGCMHV